LAHNTPSFTTFADHYHSHRADIHLFGATFGITFFVLPYVTMLRNFIPGSAVSGLTRHDEARDQVGRT
jgi:hypothetical protein